MKTVTSILAVAVVGIAAISLLWDVACLMSHEPTVTDSIRASRKLSVVAGVCVGLLVALHFVSGPKHEVVPEAVMKELDKHVQVPVMRKF